MGEEWPRGRSPQFLCARCPDSGPTELGCSAKGRRERSFQGNTGFSSYETGLRFMATILYFGASSDTNFGRYATIKVIYNHLSREFFALFGNGCFSQLISGQIE